MSDSTVPATLGKYRIDGILGEGSMGVVYRGYDAELDRRVAVKTMRKDMAAGPAGAEMLERFKREANAGMRLSHRHVVTVYEFGEDSQLAFMAMEFIEGKSLRDLNAQRAPWPLLEALELAHQLLEALDFFHERGVVHRDIKPANIMIDEAGNLTVTDFGIARTESSELTQVGTFLGTPSYMSPEQITGQPIDGRSDLF
ncbi:MAG: eukaryotic-like serine/threonine-protein kinase, partial [Pseudomonadota bacterium]|nr:eukaryotic-like serine/threonine-protein kinase [Pseudomonadota bacterium]